MFISYFQVKEICEERFTDYRNLGEIIEILGRLNLIKSVFLFEMDFEKIKEGNILELERVNRE